MALAEQLRTQTYLSRRDIPYELEFHRATDTAAAEAQALHVASDDVLKGILLRLGDQFAVAVVPASQRLDLSALRRVADDERVRLATEAEIASRYPEYDLGALPPLPGVLGIKAFVDPSVFNHQVVAFADGRRTESIFASPRALYWGEEVFVTPIARDPDDELRFEGDSLDISDD